MANTALLLFPDENADYLRRLAIAQDIADTVHRTGQLRSLGGALSLIVRGDFIEAHWSLWLSELAERPVEP